ncbi:MAG TPA: hemerythrin domain-containing protein [Acidimicrobiales bacterium]|nr:hemerythrin domain-containing protein [Acidimicrobiales bacterium]
MCSYCGCEAEPVIERLMDDHALISDLIYRIRDALDSGRPGDADSLTARLSAEFDRHSRSEEAGLFAQLREAGEAVDEVDDLVADHERLRPALAQPGPAADPDGLRELLSAVTRHAEVEDNDLFPFALQQLPNERWAALA